MLAENRVANVITVDRKLDEKTRALVLRRLAPVVSKSVKELEARLGDPRISPYTAVPVATGVDYATLAYVAEHKQEFPGVRAEAPAVHVYPNGSVGFHVLGYLGEADQNELSSKLTKQKYDLGDEIGKSGVELTYERTCGARPGSPTSRSTVPVPCCTAPRCAHRRRATTCVSRWTSTCSARPRPRWRREWKRPAAKDTAYKQGFRTLKAPAGAAIVMDATTGSLVALASAPSMDPNLFDNGIPQSTWEFLKDPANHQPLVDRAVSGLYTPGSTFKLVTAIAGLKAGLIIALLHRGRHREVLVPDGPELLLPW